MSNPQSTVKISFDSATLNAHIQCKFITNSFWSQIYLLLNAGSDNVEIKSKWTVQLPWYEFRRILTQFAEYLKKEDIKVIYDKNSKKLILNHLHDLQALNRTKNKRKSLNTSEIKKQLSNTLFKRNLTKEQLRDTSKIISLKHGANFSVPGAGKTSTLLAVYILLKKEKRLDKILVVAPRNAFISWEDEVFACFEKSAPEVIRLTGGRDRISKLLNSDPEIAIITYHQLSNVIEDVASFIQRNLVLLILDESHRIKRGVPGVHYTAAAKIADLAHRRDILSGTPMPQSPKDLLPQFDFLWPGGKLLNQAMIWQDDHKIIEIANKIVKPFYVRTTKSELGLKSPKIKITNIELGPVQFELYQLLRSETARILTNMKREDLISFRRLGRHVIRLLQMVSNPMLITSNDEYPEETDIIPPGTRKWELLTEFANYEKPIKIEYVINKVKQLTSKDRKVIIWSVFVRNIELLERLLLNLGAVSIYGAIETGDENEAHTREGRIRRFHEDPDCKVMIANPAACGEGISLHKICHNAIYLDRTFNAAHYLQSIDRIHRLGLSPEVDTEIEIISANDTIDEVINNRLKNKILTMGKVLDDFDLGALAYDPEDIVEEIPGGIDISDLDEIKIHITKELQ